MERRVSFEWVQESRALTELYNFRKSIRYMDNSSGHEITENVQKVLKKIDTEIWFFPKNATDLCQPGDSFVIQKMKTE